MSDPNRAPERIDLLRADDPRDVIHRAVASLAQGGVVGLPTESAYVLAASALVPEAAARLRAIKGGDRPISVAVRGATEAEDWSPGLSVPGRKLARRAWPGPVTLVFRGEVDRGLASCLPEAVRSIVSPNGSIGLRMPGHDAVREILNLTSGPLLITSAPYSGTPHASADGLAAMTGVDMLLDDGPIARPQANTVVEIDAEGVRVVREGTLDGASIQRMTGTLLLFVCTGNTCRSPMAEALCRVALAERLGCRPDELETRGFVVSSAGVAASHGARATPEAAEIVLARGGTLRGHSSRQVSSGLVAAADLIVAMTRDHRDALLEYHPEAEDRVRLLHPHGGDVSDPYGSDRETYRRTAEAIEAHLKPLIDELLSDR